MPRRLLALASVLSVLLIAIVAFAWLSGSDEASLNPIAQAAVHTQEAPGARMSLRAVSRRQSMSQPIVVTGEGVFNGETGRSRTTAIVSAPPHEIEMEMVGSGTTMYTRSKLLQHKLPDGDEWLGLDMSFGSSSEFAAAGNSDLSAQLSVLRAVSDEFETLGKKKIRGVETTGYRSTIDPDANAAYLRENVSAAAARRYERLAEVAPSTTRVETWIDTKGLIRRMRVEVDSRDPNSGEKISTVTTASLFDFGISPDIQLPDPGTVFDTTPLVEKELGLEGSG